jgi:Xaa-Pro aminopeptidase
LGLDTTPAYDRDELSRIDDRLRSLAEEDARAAELIIKGLGDKAKNEGFLRANKSEREILEDKKAQILSASAHSHALAKFKERLASLPEDAFDSEIDAAMDDGYAAWDEMSMENKRAILRGGYRVQLMAGGRGPERIQVSSKFPGKPD